MIADVSTITLANLAHRIGIHRGQSEVPASRSILEVRSEIARIFFRAFLNGALPLQAFSKGGCDCVRHRLAGQLRQFVGQLACFLRCRW